MTTTSMLRIASSISLLFAAGHSVGGLQKWSPVRDNPVLTAMTDVHFPIMGVSRSYLDLFLGLGWSISVFLLLQAVLLWQMASLARTNEAQVRPMIATFMLATVASGIIAWLYIFPVPALFSVALLVALAAAYWAARGAPGPTSSS
jgi:hypothetical protein